MEDKKQEQQGEQELKVVAEVNIKVFEDGSLDVNVPEESRSLQPFEIENITRDVYEGLRDQRIAQQAIQIFKSRF